MLTTQEDQKKLSIAEIAQLSPHALLAYLLMSDLDLEHLRLCLFENRWSGESFAIGIVTEYRSDLACDLLILLIRYAEHYPKEVLELLENKGSHAITIGHAISRVNDTKAVDKYLHLLRILANTHPKATLNLLGAMDYDGNLIGHLLARTQDETANQCFIRLLARVAQKKPMAVLNYLSLKEPSDNTLIHEMAKKEQGAANQELIGLLTKLAEKYHSHIFKLLYLPVASSQNVVHFFAQTQNSVTINQWLDFVAETATIDEQITILSLANTDNQTAGHIIAASTDQTVKTNFLQLLENMAKTKPHEVVRILILGQNEHKTIGHILAESKNVVSKHQFLSLLKAIASTYPRKVLDILHLQDNSGYTIGHRVVNSPDTTSCLLFLELLFLLARTNADLVIILLRLKDIAAKAIISHMILSKQRGRVNVRHLELLEELAKHSPQQVFQIVITYNKYESGVTNKKTWHRGGESLGYMLVKNCSHYWQPLAQHLLSLLVEIEGSERHDVFKELDQPKSMLRALYKKHMKNNVSNIKLFFELLLHGVAKDNPKLIPFIESDMESWKVIGQTIFILGDASLLFKYLILSDRLKDEELLSSTRRLSNDFKGATVITDFVCSEPLTLEKMTMGQNALRKDTTLHKLLKAPINQETNCFYSFFTRSPTYLDRLETVINKDAYGSGLRSRVVS